MIKRLIKVISVPTIGLILLLVFMLIEMPISGIKWIITGNGLDNVLLDKYLYILENW